MIQTLATTLLVAGIAAILAIAAAAYVEDRAARRKCRPVQTIVGFRPPVSGYAPDSDTPPCGWPCAILLTIAALALAFAFVHIAVAAGF